MAQEAAEPEPAPVEEDVAADDFSAAPKEADEDEESVPDPPDDEPAEESEPLDPEDFASERESLR